MDMVTPAGFRDVLSQEAQTREGITDAVRSLFSQKGYVPIETPTLEVMDVMRAGGHLSGAPFKFFDSQGDLLAMRPDVTLQVARMCATRLAGQPGPFRFRYQQRVFRETEGQMRAAAREVTQMGIECIGLGGPDIDAEVIGLCVAALEASGVSDFYIVLATVGVLRALLAASGAPQEWVTQVFSAYHSSNLVDLDQLTDTQKACPAPPVFADAIRALPRIRGGVEAIDEARKLVEPLGCTDGLDDLAQVVSSLEQSGLAGRIRIDFSVMNSFDYYTGMVFQACSPQVGSPLGSGGRYDKMLAAYGDARPAAGFAFFLEQAMAAAGLAETGSPAVVSAALETGSSAVVSAALEAATTGLAASDAAKTKAGAFDAGETKISMSDAEAGVVPVSASATISPASHPILGVIGSKRPLRIAVPKGSLNAGTIEVLAQAGLEVAGLEDPGRSLIIHNPGVDYIIVRPSDAPVFVELGAADCGICGKDSLLEANAEVVELANLAFGACRFVVAQPAGAQEAVQEHYRRLGSIRVATKYPRIAAAHFAKTGMQVEIVKLHGNIELAPLTGMAECIVDITATGTTLRENNLVVVEEVLPSTARFFANACAYRTDGRIARLARALAQSVESCS